jgi:hypothetical protein
MRGFIIAIVMTSLALLPGIFVTASSARGASVTDAPLAACSPDKGPIGAVKPCGKVWKLSSGQATLGADGTIKVTLHGLVLDDTSVGNANGTPDGVDAVAVAVSCNAVTGSAPSAQTEPMALSHAGDATIDAKLELPQSCASPRVLVRERYEGKIGGWLAATAP